MIKAVLFDLGGTLIKGSELNEIVRIYDRFLKSYGVTRNLEEIIQAYKMANKKENIDTFLGSNRGFWLEFNIFFLNELKVKEKITELAKVLDSEWWSIVKVSSYPDMMPTINELRRRNLKVGIVSNGLENDIKQILKLIEMDGLFDIEVGIDTFRSSKPGKKIFTETLAELTLLPSEVLYVGDSLENDYMSAKRIGINVLLIDRENKVKKKGIRKITDLKNTLEYV
jgi:HAD superfamily hydrolase (TIGR01549 family)